MELKQSDKDEIMRWAHDRVANVPEKSRYKMFEDWWGTFREWDVNIWMPWDNESVVIVSAYPLTLTWDDGHVTIDGSVWYRVGEIDWKEL